MGTWRAAATGESGPGGTCSASGHLASGSEKHVIDSVRIAFKSGVLKEAAFGLSQRYVERPAYERRSMPLGSILPDAVRSKRLFYAQRRPQVAL